MFRIASVDTHIFRSGLEAGFGGGDGGGRVHFHVLLLQLLLLFRCVLFYLKIVFNAELLHLLLRPALSLFVSTFRGEIGMFHERQSCRSVDQRNGQRSGFRARLRSIGTIFVLLLGYLSQTFRPQRALNAENSNQINLISFKLNLKLIFLSRTLFRLLHSLPKSAFCVLASSAALSHPCSCSSSRLIRHSGVGHRQRRIRERHSLGTKYKTFKGVRGSAFPTRANPTRESKSAHANLEFVAEGRFANSQNVQKYPFEFKNNSNLAKCKYYPATKLCLRGGNSTSV